jgi:hypothetical protein
MKTLQDFVQFSSFNLVRRDGDRHGMVASFDIEIAGISIRGCALIHTKKNGVAISMPRLYGQRECGVRFTDHLLHNAVVAAARKAYLACGGTDLPDWAMKSDAPVNAEVANGADSISI